MDKEEAFRLLLLILVHESTMKIHYANAEYQKHCLFLPAGIIVKEAGVV